MKKLNTILGIIVGLTIISCSSDDDFQDSTVTKNLVSIKKDFYVHNNLNWTHKYNFIDNKLNDIQYSNGGHDVIYYEGNLISKILEYDTNNNLEWTITYTYDELNRLTKKNVTPSPDNTITDVSRQKEVFYNENLIHSEKTWSDGGFNKYTMILNSENQIIEDNLLNANNDLITKTQFEYLNNNVYKQTQKLWGVNTVYEGTYNYLDKVGSEAYKYNQYLFGSHWKNNSALNKQGGLIQVIPYEISENYISDYYEINYGTNSWRSGTFVYKFDTNNHIVRQTEFISTSYGESFKLVTHYEYE